MTASAFKRGHPIMFQGGTWLYADNGQLMTVERPCRRCGELPTPEGHDACLGTLPGIVGACCGHGVEEPYRVKGKTLFCHHLSEYGYSLGYCCPQCHGVKKDGIFFWHHMRDGNLAHVCGGAAEFLLQNDLLLPDPNRLIHGCEWREYVELRSSPDSIPAG